MEGRTGEKCRHLGGKVTESDGRQGKPWILNEVMFEAPIVNSRVSELSIIPGVSWGKFILQGAYHTQVDHMDGVVCGSIQNFVHVIYCQCIQLEYIISLAPA